MAKKTDILTLANVQKDVNLTYWNSIRWIGSMQGQLLLVNPDLLFL